MVTAFTGRRARQNFSRGRGKRNSPVAEAPLQEAVQEGCHPDHVAQGLQLSREQEAEYPKDPNRKPPSDRRRDEYLEQWWGETMVGRRFHREDPR
jgi:hypothetical protein